MRRRLFRVFSRTARDRAREVDEEIEAHLAMRASDLEARGASPEEARSQALARFGDVDAAKQVLVAASRSRDRRLGWHERLDGVNRDLRVAFRRALARPGHALVSVLIFGLGIGITTVMFSITDHVLLRPLPFPEPDRLVSLQSVPENGSSFESVSMGNWYDWKIGTRALQSTGLYRTSEVTVAFGAEVARLPAATVSGSFFETLRAPFLRGRGFLEEEAQEGAPLVVVSEGFWSRTLGREETLAGTRISVNGIDRQVVGVLPEGMALPSGVDLWIPYRARPFTGDARNNINWLALGRLSKDVTVEQAAAELSAIAEGIRRTDPAARYSYGVGLVPLQAVVVGETGRSILLLQGSVFLVLLIACGNLMGLEFARGRERQEEVSVRLSMGVSRLRLVQQLVTEQLVLAMAGGIVGLGLAWHGTGFVMDRLGAALPRAQEVTFDGRVLAFGFGLSLLAGLLASLGPAWRASGGSPGRVLAGTRSVRGGRGLPGGMLVSAEVALTVILLVAGGLLVRSMNVLVNRDLGFDDEGLITLDVTLLNPEYLQDGDQVESYWTRLLAILDDTPGVRFAGASNWIPTGRQGSTFVQLPETGRASDGAGYRVVTDGYFEAMGTPLLQGRSFDLDDQAGSARVVVVNEAMAEAFWPQVSPVGRRVKAEGMEGYGDEAPWLTVVGVVGNMRHGGYEREPRPEMFTLYRQVPAMMRVGTAVVRSEPGSVGTVMESALARARNLDPSVAVQAGLLSERVRGLMAERNLITGILVAFAAIALGLASLGIYGILSFAVSSRTREMAIRSALGAGRAGLVSLVVRSGMVVVAAGLLVGAAGALALGAVLDSLLVEVSATDPMTAFVVVLAVLTVSVFAALLPAVRAASLDPLEALREG